MIFNRNFAKYISKMFEYILTVISLTVLTIFAYIKLKYPFWNIQPVYHSYDYWRMLYKTPFTIYKYRPVKTKFTDLAHVHTYPFDDLSADHLADIVNLLQCYYIPTDRIIHTIQSADLTSVLTGQIHTSFVSIYNDIHYEYNKNAIIDGSANIIIKQKPIGCITSRSLRFLYRVGSIPNTYTEESVYYMDYLCVNREHNQLNLNRKLLQTHEYNQRLHNKNVSVSLIRKEGDLFVGIVPLVQFKTHTFHIDNIKFPKLPAKHHVRSIDIENLDILMDYFQSEPITDPKTEFFDLLFFPDIGNITAQLKQGILTGYYLMIEGEVLAFYFFKNTKMTYDDIEGNTSHLMASVMNCYSVNLFHVGFLHALRRQMQIQSNLRILLIDEIGHNVNLMSVWRYKNTPLLTTDTGYYLFNMVYPGSPLLRERCLVIT